MYRRERDRASTLRKWRRFVKNRTNVDWYGEDYSSPLLDQVGRFRKNSGMGCPAGRKCYVCHDQFRPPDRQEQRSDINFEEYREEVT